MARASQPPTQLTPPPRQQGRAALFVGIAAIGLAALAVGAFVFLRGGPPAPAPAHRPQVEGAVVKPQETPVFLSVVSEPLDADVVATWKDGGEKRGAAPFSLEVPRSARVHFEFRKSGYLDYSMDVIADQPQTVQAALKPAPSVRPAPIAIEVSEKKPRGDKKPKKERAPQSSDGVVDVLGDLK
jgi:hypothetical protein